MSCICAGTTLRREVGAGDCFYTGSSDRTTTAIYEFLIEMVKLQRAIAWFEHDYSAEERDELFRELEARLAGSQAEPAAEEN